VLTINKPVVKLTAAQAYDACNSISVTAATATTVPRNVMSLHAVLQILICYLYDGYCANVQILLLTAASW
jgi:hypothetical protein